MTRLSLNSRFIFRRAPFLSSISKFVSALCVLLLTELLRWMLTCGQKKCSGLGYAPLPAEVAKRALDSFDSVK